MTIEKGAKFKTKVNKLDTPAGTPVIFNGTVGKKDDRYLQCDIVGGAGSLFYTLDELERAK